MMMVRLSCMTETANKLDVMNEIILQLVENAKAIVVGRRKEEGGEQIVRWQDIFDKYSLNTNQPLFRTLEGHGHTDFVIDTDVEILTQYVVEEHTKDQQRELKLRAAIHFWNEFDKKHPEYRWTSYITGQGMYRIQRIDKEVDKADFIDILWGEHGILSECAYQKRYEREGKTHICKPSCDGFFVITPENNPSPKTKRGLGKVIELEGVQYLIIIDSALYKR